VADAYYGEPDVWSVAPRTAQAERQRGGSSGGTGADGTAMTHWYDSASSRTGDDL